MPHARTTIDRRVEGSPQGGLKSNKEYLTDRTQPDGVGEDDLLPLSDPQTSGGLLMAVPKARTSALVGALQKRGVTSAIVGEVVEQPGIKVAR